MLEKGSMVKYVGQGNSVLFVGEEYKVAEVFEDGGIRVFIPTGFAGMKADEFELVTS